MVILDKPRRAEWVAALVVVLWTITYCWRGLVGHLNLTTNAYDLSVFDYALWSLAHGHAGVVPFMGHSIFAHHFMPILGLLVPAYWPAQDPIFLVVFQILAFAAAAWVFFRLQRQMGIDPTSALLLLGAFLLTRRNHGAVTSFSYPEALQPLLTFGVVLAWWQHSWRKYWILVLLWLMTKEDVVIYLGAFGAAQMIVWRRERLAGAAAIGLALVWCAAALWAIAAVRGAEGLGTANPLLQNRFAAASGSFEISALLRNVFSGRSANTLLMLVVGAGLLPIAGWEWLAVTLPGILVNLAASQDSMQSALIDHYAWPIMPWLFIAAAAGAVRVQRWSSRVSRVWLLLFCIVCVVDNPAVQRVFTTSASPEARDTRRQIATLHIETNGVVLAQPQLVPHLPHFEHLFTIGIGPDPGRPADLVLLSTAGDLWPLTRPDVDRVVARYRADPDYELISNGPLFAFRRASRR